jgi:soluble lytic murein transglycosylase-like protein
MAQERSMSVETVGARLAEIDGLMAAVRTGTPGAAAPTTSFAQTLQTAQATTPVATAAASAGAGTATPYDAQISAAATQYGVDPALLKGLIRQESNFDPAARSPAGATGLTQLMPGTASSLGVDATDPTQAIDGGARYLKQQLDRFGGDAAKALAAYNAGPGAVAKFGGVPPYAETQAYVQKVLGFAAQYGMATTPAAATPLPIPTTPVLAAPSTGLDYSTL